MLTPAQQATVKSDIQNTPELNAFPNNSDGAFAIAALYNAAASPAFTVWRTAVPIDEMMGNGFVWNEVDALTAGQARIWQWMAQLGIVNPSKASVRQGLNNAFSVNAPNTLGNTATGVGGIQPHLRRLTSRIEKLFATGTGTTAAPGTLTFEGQVSLQDIEQARNS
jgi:hypothetical protein